MKVLSNIIAETLLRHCKDPEKPNVFLLGATDISVVHFVEPPFTIHSDLGLNLERHSPADLFRKSHPIKTPLPS